MELASWPSHFYFLLNTIDRCIDRSSVDQCINLYIDRYQPIQSVKVKCRWSIGAVSVKYWWSLGEPPSISTDKSICQYIVWCSADISIYTQSSIDRYSIKYRPMYQPIYTSVVAPHKIPDPLCPECTFNFLLKKEA